MNCMNFRLYTVTHNEVYFLNTSYILALYITGATDYSKEFPVEVWLAAMVSESEPLHLSTQMNSRSGLTMS